MPILSRNSLPQAATETNFPPPHAKLSQANTSTPKHVPTKQQTSTVDDQKPVTKPPQSVTIVPVNSPKQVATDLPTATVIGNDGTPFKITNITHQKQKATVMDIDLDQSSILMNPPPENDDIDITHDDISLADPSRENDNIDMTHDDIRLADRRQPDESIQDSLPVHPENDNRDTTHSDINLADRRQPDGSIQDSLSIHLGNDSRDTTNSDSNLADRSQPDESIQDSLPVPASVKQLRQGRWHTAEELYNLITQPTEVNSDVPPGDKSNCYLL